jgi:hypothetical protein
MARQLAERGHVPAPGAEDAVQWLKSKLDSIRVLGVGTCDLSANWSAIAGHVESVAYDPLGPGDEAAQAPGGLVTASAVSPYGGEEELNVARNPGRSSLLEPNWPLISRHGGASEFEIWSRRTVPSVTPQQIAEAHGPFDAIRLHCQGLEYQLISSALPLIKQAVCIEVDGGMVDNYVGQYPFAVVAPLLYGAGYSLLSFDCRARRPSCWDARASTQPLEYRGLWLRDAVGHRDSPIGFGQAVKLAVLCKAFGYLPFGHELAIWLADQSLLPPDIARTLCTMKFWTASWGRELTGPGT